MRFQLCQDFKADSIQPRVNPIQGAPEILPMIDASSLNVRRRASGCQAIMGHHVGLRGGRESIERNHRGPLRTAGIATLSINHRSMTGTCSVSHEFELAFRSPVLSPQSVIETWDYFELPLIGWRYHHGVSYGMRRRDGIENWDRLSNWKLYLLSVAVNDVGQQWSITRRDRLCFLSILSNIISIINNKYTAVTSHMLICQQQIFIKIP